MRSLLFCLLLAGCAATEPGNAPLSASQPDTQAAVPPPSTPPPPMPPVPPDASWLLATPLPALQPTGDPRVDAYRERLLAADPSWSAILQRLLFDVKADPEILAHHDRMAKMTGAAAYIDHYVTAERIAAGRAEYQRYKDDPLLAETQPEAVIALWGVFADYGANPPPHDAFSALVTLLAHGRPVGDTAFPIHDAAILILERKATRDQLKAYASGRLGQAQMTPDQFARLARDGNGDGRIDVWTTPADILASIRFPVREYYREPLVVPVKPESFDRNDPGEARIVNGLESSSIQLTYFQRYDGRPLTPEEARMRGFYTEPFGKDGPAFLLSSGGEIFGYHFPYGLYYESNRDFALAVALLAEAIAGRPIPAIPKQ